MIVDLVDHFTRDILDVWKMKNGNMEEVVSHLATIYIANQKATEGDMGASVAKLRANGDDLHVEISLPWDKSEGKKPLVTVSFKIKLPTDEPRPAVVSFKAREPHYFNRQIVVSVDGENWLIVAEKSVPDGVVRKRPQPEFEKNRLPPPDAGDAAARLVDQHIPKVAPIREITAAIADAQRQPPADKQQFVDDINRLLEVFQLRIKGDDGAFYRLRVTPGRNETSFIQLATGGRSRGFKHASFEVALMPNRAKNGVILQPN